MSAGGKILLMVVSFFLSLTLWFYVQTQEKPSKPPASSYTLSITPINKPDSLYVVIQPDNIKVLPVGSIVERARIKEEDLMATIDLSKAKPGTFTYPISVKVPADVGVRFKLQPPEASVVIQRTRTHAVRVQVPTSGELPNPSYLYLPDSTYTEPSTVIVTGPESEVDQIVAARADLDLADVSSPGRTFAGDVYLVRKDNSPAPTTVTCDPKKVLIHPAMVPGAEIRPYHLVPIFKGQPAAGLAVQVIYVIPENVSVRGRIEVLSIKSWVPLKEIDLTGLKETKTFVATPALLPGAFLTTAEPIKVTVTIEATSKRAREATPEDSSSPRRRRRGG